MHTYIHTYVCIPSHLAHTCPHLHWRSAHTCCSERSRHERRGWQPEQVYQSTPNWPLAQGTSEQHSSPCCAAMYVYEIIVAPREPWGSPRKLFVGTPCFTFNLYTYVRSFPPRLTNQLTASFFCTQPQPIPFTLTYKTRRSHLCTQTETPAHTHAQSSHNIVNHSTHSSTHRYIVCLL